MPPPASSNPLGHGARLFVKEGVKQREWDGRSPAPAELAKPSTSFGPPTQVVTPGGQAGLRWLYGPEGSRRKGIVFTRAPRAWRRRRRGGGHGHQPILISETASGG